MGVSNGDFVKYPRTPHLFGSTGTADDKHLDEKGSSLTPNFTFPRTREGWFCSVQPTVT
jgi:hypothetical protein